MDLHQLFGSCDDVGCADSGVEFIDLKGWCQEGVVPGHNVHKVGVISDIAAVLDRVNTGLYAHPQSRSAHGVTHGVFLLGFSLGHQGFDLVLAKCDVHRAMS